MNLTSPGMCIEWNWPLLLWVRVELEVETKNLGPRCIWIPFVLRHTKTPWMCIKLAFSIYFTLYPPPPLPTFFSLEHTYPGFSPSKFAKFHKFVNICSPPLPLKYPYYAPPKKIAPKIRPHSSTLPCWEIAIFGISIKLKVGLINSFPLLGRQGIYFE